MVLQETWLKSGTIRENLMMGRPDATEEEMIQAAKAAHAHSFIKRMPKGYDTDDSDRMADLFLRDRNSCLCITQSYALLTTDAYS